MLNWISYLHSLFVAVAQHIAVMSLGGPSCLREAYWSVLTRLYMIRNASVVYWLLKLTGIIVILLAHRWIPVRAAARSSFCFDLVQIYWHGAILNSKQTHKAACLCCFAADSVSLHHHYNAGDIRSIQNWDFDLLSFSSTGTLYHLFSKLPRRKVWPRWPHLLLSVPGLEKLPERHIWC